MKFAHHFKAWVEEFETALWDRVLGIDTLGCRAGERPAGGLQPDAQHYQSKCYYLIWRQLRPVGMGNEDVFYDIGCGAGRVLCIASLRRVRKCVGIELSSALCGQARENARRLHFRRAPIEIREGDATGANFSGGTVYFLFNPFGAGTLGSVLGAIHEDVARQPRRVQLVYINPVCREIFRDQDWLRQTAEHRFAGSPLPVCYYENCEAHTLPKPGAAAIPERKAG